MLSDSPDMCKVIISAYFRKHEHEKNTFLKAAQLHSTMFSASVERSCSSSNLRTGSWTAENEAGAIQDP